MNKPTKFRRLMLAFIAMLPLILSLWSSQAVFAATARADISITLVANRKEVKMGQDVTYTAYMTNHGPDEASFVDVSFSWPSQLNFVSMSCDEGISPDTPNCEYSSLAAGQTVVSTFVATPAPGLRGHKKATVTATVLFEVDCKFDPNCTFDPNRRNNTDRVTTLVGRPDHH